MDNLGITNALVDALLPVLNAKLPAAIRAAKLDPWATVDHGEKTLGKVNLGICTARAEASYSITEMKGLSSIELLSAEVETLDASGGGKVRGTLSLRARLNKQLSARARGTVMGECGSLRESAIIKGTVAVKGVSATFSGSFRGDLGRGESCVTSLKITGSTWKYSDIDVAIDGLGVFNSVLDAAIDAVGTLAGKAFTQAIAPALDEALNEVLKDEMPVCIAVKDVSGASIGQAAGTAK